MGPHAQQNNKYSVSAAEVQETRIPRAFDLFENRFEYQIVCAEEKKCAHGT
jgi:hypothetical protein